MAKRKIQSGPPMSVWGIFLKMESKIDWLEHYKAKYGAFKTMALGADRPYWKSKKVYPDDFKLKIDYELVNNREIFKDEIVLDIDEPYMIWEVVEKLRNRGLSFRLFRSGGKGYHIHMFAPELLSYDEKERTMIRKMIISEFGGDVMKASERSMIALEYSKHRKTAQLKELILEEKGKEIDISFYAEAIKLMEFARANGIEANIQDIREFVELWNNPNKTEVIWAALDDLIKKETESKRTLFLIFLSSKFDEPCGARVVGDSSIGKTFLVRETLSLFPPKMIMALGGQSKTSLKHRKADRIEQGKHYINLRNKILWFLEESGSEESYSLLRPILSRDRDKIEFETTVSTGKGFFVKKTVIEGCPCFVTTSTKLGTLEEMGTRVFNISPTEDEEQTKAVLEFKTIKEMNRPIFKSKYKHIQLFIAALKPIDVWVPWAMLLDMTVLNPRARRDFDKILTLIKAHALLNQQNRPLVQFRNGKKMLLATIEDFLAVKKLLAPIIEPTVMNVAWPVIKFFRKLTKVLKEVGMATHKKIAEELLMNQATVRKYCTILYQNGWLLMEKQGRENVYVENPTLREKVVGDFIKLADSKEVFERFVNEMLKVAENMVWIAFPNRVSTGNEGLKILTQISNLVGIRLETAKSHYFSILSSRKIFQKCDKKLGYTAIFNIINPYVKYDVMDFNIDVIDYNISPYAYILDFYHTSPLEIKDVKLLLKLRLIKDIVSIDNIPFTNDKERIINLLYDIYLRKVRGNIRVIETNELENREIRMKSEITIDFLKAEDKLNYSSDKWEEVYPNQKEQIEATIEKLKKDYFSKMSKKKRVEIFLNELGKEGTLSQKSAHILMKKLQLSKEADQILKKLRQEGCIFYPDDNTISIVEKI